MEALATSDYDTTPAAIGGAFRVLSAVPKISKNLAAYLTCLIVFTQYFGGTADLRAAGLGEAHTDVVLRVLKLATDSNYTDFQVSLWNGIKQRRPVVVDGDGEAGKGGASGGA